MGMSRIEAIKGACEIFSLAYHSIGNYAKPSDGFCDECPAAQGRVWSYQNAGEMHDFVRAAVVDALKKHGYTVNLTHFYPDGKVRKNA